MRIEWTVEAEAELEEMLDYVSERSSQGANSLTQRIAKSLTSILTFPRAGKFDKETDTYDCYVPQTHVVLTYAIKGDLIWIITVWHTSRDPATKPRRKM